MTARLFPMGTNAPRPTALVQLWTSSTHTLTLTCTVADQGYEVGDVIEIDSGGRHGIEYDATNVYYYTSSIGIWFTLGNSGRTGSDQLLDLGIWSA